MIANACRVLGQSNKMFWMFYEGTWLEVKAIFKSRKKKIVNFFLILQWNKPIKYQINLVECHFSCKVKKFQSVNQGALPHTG